MEIFLIRHGECESREGRKYLDETGVQNPPLTENGIKQARALSEKLKGIEFDAIISSDLFRAMKTAEIVNEPHHALRIVDERFREINMGELETKSWNEYPKEFEKWKMHEEDMPYPEGENGEVVFKRFYEGLVQLTKTDYQSVAVVTHGGAILCAVSGLLEIPFHKRFLLGPPVYNCSITKILYDGEKFIINSFNNI